MKKRNKTLVILSILGLISTALTGCGKKDGVFTIGVSQYVEHAALDASYKGFVDALAEAGYVDGEKIKIDYQNAQGDQSNTNTIATKLVNDNNDLILAIATPSAQAVANATKDIPVLVTAVTDPYDAGLVESNEAPGGNISGTSDLTPVRKQFELLTQLIPDAKKVAILYTSSETNSKIQAQIAREAAEEFGLETVDATVSNTNEIQQVVESLIGKVDAIYAPTDNLIAKAMPTVAMVANSSELPIICGEKGMVESGGLATYGIDYYELGKLTGQQAVQIIEGKAKTEDMPIGYLAEEDCELTINEDVAKQLGIEIPGDLK
ncbi:ABC transporter substrate-binding protein [Anaerocolumna aminovalerica]|jgi:putative ABC transport system substrate-binding protein|uniref:Putative ABC transport system substrate-binding protein n=1 Tax=Anaerocolumna aminovalerica TaxID=1527 RepID=A0A1I5C1Z4_9FIRM|nr:ABC transporter substrate-binding protein [Anaerocolumna aminovalerica]MDU6262986.1 ABC transporter substrate-binding protein [Anaerocolumna aminovalerica]SFN81043.1 putative ABC transport system substrate-binding protein [Anaerocolumna aminovalerica]